MDIKPTTTMESFSIIPIEKFTPSNLISEVNKIYIKDKITVEDEIMIEIFFEYFCNILLKVPWFEKIKPAINPTTARFNVNPK